MKVFIALLVATFAIATQGSYVSSAWPAGSLGWNSWNGLNDWNSWNDHGVVDTPYVKSWSSAWPIASPLSGWNGWNGWNGPKATIVQANVAKLNPWGLQWGGAYGHGYSNYLGVPSAKYVAANPGSVHVAPLAGHAINQKLIVA